MATFNGNKPNEEDVVKQLNELFGKVLNVDVIQTVANSCRYDVLKSTDRLIEISSFYSAKAFNDSSSGNMEPGNPPKNLNTMSRSTTSSSTSIGSAKSKKAADLERTISYILQGYKVLVLMRGMPGSGKSTQARLILESTIGYDSNHGMHIFSTDDYFYQNRQGLYMYDKNNIGEAHDWNQKRVFQYMSRGFSPIIVDNTNVKMWEMKPYATMATDYGYIIEIIEPETHWAFNARELSRRNRHGVAITKIKDMIENYEKNISPRKLLNDYNLVYKLQKPPQLRLYPPPDIKITQPQNPSPPHISSAQTNTTVKSITASIFNLSTKGAKPIETINLMDFDDETPTSSVPAVNSNSENSNREQNLVDKFLMCNNSEMTKLLQPFQKNQDDVILIDSDNERSYKQDSQPFPDIEKAWGINEKSLRTWEIVTPIKDEVIAPAKAKQPEIPKVITASSECNTEDKYFRFLERGNISAANIDGIKILRTVNRDINRFSSTNNIAVHKRPMFDQSCMTEDVYESSENHLGQLTSLFPNVPDKQLKYWYNKCNGDLEGTIEFLLEVEDASNLVDDDELENYQCQPIKVNGSDSDSSSGNDVDVPVRPRKARKLRRNSDESNELKKILESKVDISDSHYSEKLLKVKQYKNNSTKLDKNVTKSSTSYCEPTDNKPSCSKDKVVYEVICVDSDMDFDDIEISDKLEPQIEDTVELNLGDQFVAQLEQHFGDPNMGYPQGYQPIIQMPVTLARQLYTFYVESVYQQMDNQKYIMENMAKEDEEFAKKLQAEENKCATPEKKYIPDLREIIEEQIVLSKHQKEIDKWKNLNPNNLAATLTRQKLYSLFPTIDKDALVEILHAHDNKYRETVETLLVSTGMDKFSGDIDAIKEPPINDETLQEMKDAHTKNTSEEYTEVRKATYYREEANKYLQRRTDLYQKAQLYYNKGMLEVAQFYSGLATKQTEYYERANSLAATTFLDEHAKRLENFNTLDLHFLHVKEAIQALDMFLDKNINLLRLSKLKNIEYLHIITGRGKNSPNGVPKIRPAIMRRLRARNVNSGLLNPGLLKIKITKQSLLTNEVNEN